MISRPATDDTQIQGSVNCEAARSPAETYIDNTIMDKIRHEMRFEYYPQDMYVWSKCL